jgi:hypothetical protein
MTRKKTILGRELIRTGVSDQVFAVLEDMADSGLHGSGLSGVVREALQRTAREYLRDASRRLVDDRDTGGGLKVRQR